MTAALWLFYGLFVLFAIVAWYCVLTFVCEITISSDQLVCRSLVGRKVITRDHIRDIQIQVAGRSSAVTIRLIPKGSRTILLKSFAPSLGSALQKWKETHPSASRLDQVNQEFGMKDFGNICLGFGIFLGSLLTLSGYQVGGIVPSLIIGIPFGGVFVFIGLDCYRSYVRLNSDGIERFRFGKKSTVRWHDITEIQLVNYSSREGKYEATKICSSGKPMFVGKGFDNYALLRDAILKRVDPSKVVDTRARN